MKQPASIEISQKAQELKSRGVNIIDLSVGQPDFQPPINANIMHKVLSQENHSGYSSPFGIPELRTLISTYVNQKHDTSLSAGNIIVTPGAKLGLLYTINALCPRDSQIIIPEPCWLSYQELARYSGVNIKTVPSIAINRFIPTLANILAAIVPSTKAVLINNPVNPSGVCWPSSLLRNLLTELKKRNIYLILDAIYDDFDFHQKIETLHALCQSKTLSHLAYVHGFSKSLALTGHRLGYIASDEGTISKIATIQSNLMTCPSTFSQHIVEQILLQDQERYISTQVKEFKKRAAFFTAKLIEKNIPFISPDGAFYILVDTRVLTPKSAEASMILLDKYHLASVPGAAYGVSAEGYVRLSLTQPISILNQAIELLAKALKKNE